MSPNSDDEERLLQAIHDGDAEAIGSLFELHRARLLRTVHLRLDRRLRPRVDPADILQETFLVVSRRIGEYLVRREVCLFVWLRFLTVQQVVDCHRQNLQASKRDASREVSLDDVELLATHMLLNSSTPCRKAMRAELQEKLQQILQQMPTLERDILVLRHLEQLSTREVAETLQMNESSVSTRHVRGLLKLKTLLSAHAEFHDLLDSGFR